MMICFVTSFGVKLLISILRCDDTC